MVRPVDLRLKYAQNVQLNRRDSQQEKCNSPTMITAAQCRAARALRDCSRETLAVESGVALRTIVDFERGARVPRADTLQKIRAALEKAGVILVEENGEGPGVRLRKGK